MKNIVDELNKISEEQDLIEKAKEGYKKCLSNNPFLYDELPPESDLSLKLWSQNMTFCHVLYEIPNVETTLKIMHEDQEVGYYQFISDINGEQLDEYFVVH